MKCEWPRAAGSRITLGSRTKKSTGSSALFFWPCPDLDHPGTPPLFDGGVSFFPDGKCRFNIAEWRESGDPVSEEFPVYLTTGRVVSQYLSGAQTRRIGGLVDIIPNRASKSILGWRPNLESLITIG